MGQKMIADLQQRLSKASGSAQAQVQQLQHQMAQVSVPCIARHRLLPTSHAASLSKGDTPVYHCSSVG